LNPPTTVVLYSRAECHLCDEARSAILSLRDEGQSFELREIDIESDDQLHARYLERIPVVSIADEVVSELVLDLDALRSRLDTVPA
jgi:predicted DCC family thiol-disulfide oxidoreductase YuxK